MIIRCIWQTDTIEATLAGKTLDNGSALCVYHFAAALPIVDGKLTVGLLTYHIDGACDIQFRIEDGPLLTIGRNTVILHETEEMLLFPFHVNMLDGSCILKDTVGAKGSVTEKVLCLLVHKRAHLAGHLTVTVPFRQCLFDGDAIALPMPTSRSLSIKAFKEIGYQRTDGQEPLLAFVRVNMSFWLKIDVLVLVKDCIFSCSVIVFLFWVQKYKKSHRLHRFSRIICIFAPRRLKTTSMKEPYLADKDRYTNGMEYERCGRSGVLLPKVSLGFWHNFGSVDPYERSREITHFAFDHGITHFDLANNYGPVYGSAEETLGRLMDEDFRPYRDELFISTKAGYDMWPGPYGDWGSRKYLMASLDQSLKRMRIKYVDLFYSHRYDPNTPLEETLQALVDIVRQGKALYVGISNWPLEPLRFGYDYLKAHDVPLLIYQGRLNMLDRKPQDEGILDFCAEKGVGFIAFSPLAQGLLTDRYLNGIPADSRMAKEKFLKKEMLTPQLLEKLKYYNEVADNRGETLAEMALAWILHQKGVISVLVGASSTAQLEKNLKSVSAAPFDEEL